MSSILPSLSPSLPMASWPRQVFISSVVGIRCLSFGLGGVRVCSCGCGCGRPDGVRAGGLPVGRGSDAAGAGAGARSRAAVGRGRDLVLVLARLVLGALAALLHVALDLVLVLLAAVVGGAQQVGGDLAAAETERERAGEGEHAQQRGVR